MQPGSLRYSKAFTSPLSFVYGLTLCVRENLILTSRWYTVSYQSAFRVKCVHTIELVVSGLTYPLAQLNNELVWVRYNMDARYFVLIGIPCHKVLEIMHILCLGINQAL